MRINRPQKRTTTPRFINSSGILHYAGMKFRISARICGGTPPEGYGRPDAPGHIHRSLLPARGEAHVPDPAALIAFAWLRMNVSSAAWGLPGASVWPACSADRPGRNSNSDLQQQFIGDTFLAPHWLVHGHFGD